MSIGCKGKCHQMITTGGGASSAYRMGFKGVPSAVYLSNMKAFDALAVVMCCAPKVGERATK